MPDEETFVPRVTEKLEYILDCECGFHKNIGIGLIGLAKSWKQVEEEQSGHQGKGHFMVVKTRWSDGRII